MSEPPVTAEQMEDLDAIAGTVEALADVLVGDDGSAATLHMASSVFRRAAETLDEIGEAWTKQEKSP